MTLTSTPEYFWARVNKETGPWCERLQSRCWLWEGRLTIPTATSEGGRGVLSYQGKQVQAHRLAFFFTHGKWPEPCCLHHCDNPPCCNPEHLYAGTQSDNMRDMYNRGRANRPTGIGWNQSHLTDSDVQMIRERYAVGNVSQTALAREFGIAQSHISRIVNRQTRTEIG